MLGVKVLEAAGLRTLAFEGSASVEGMRLVRHRLRNWAPNPLVRAVLLRGSAGEDGAFDGALDAAARHAAARATQSSAHALATSSTPTLAVVDGAARGVGAAFALHSRFGVATANGSLCFDDSAAGRALRAGASFALPRLAHNVGAWMALTGATIGGADLVHAGAASHFAAGDSADEFLATFDFSLATIAPGDGSVRLALDMAGALEAAPATWLSEHAELVSSCFAPLQPKVAAPARAAAAPKGAKRGAKNPAPGGAPKAQQQKRKRKPQQAGAKRGAVRGAKAAASFSSAATSSEADAEAQLAADAEAALQATVVSVTAARGALAETKELLSAVGGSGSEAQWAQQSLAALERGAAASAAAQIVSAQLLMQRSRHVNDALEAEHRVAQRAVASPLAADAADAAIRALLAPLEAAAHGLRLPAPRPTASRDATAGATERARLIAEVANEFNA
jgi:enoyl-CoA hydratase/carnithine racemase